MPVYEYLCESCGEHFEVRQKFSDEPVTVHEKCGGKVNKLLSVPSLQFKGSGFYITDYAKGSNPGSNPPAKKTDGGGGSSTSSSGDSSSSSTPASAPAKTESKPNSGS